MPGWEAQLRLGEITATHIDETFDVNVKGTIFTVQKALPLMGRRWFDHPDRIERRHHGCPGVYRLQREQGGSAQPRADLGRRT